MALALRPRMILLDDLLAGLTPTEGTRATAILAHPRRALARRWMKRLASRLTWWHKLPHKSTSRSTPQ